MKHLVRIAVSLSLGLAIVAPAWCGPVGEDKTETTLTSEPKIVLWIELNVNSDSAIKDAVAGLNAWREPDRDDDRIGRRAKSSFYSELKEQFPNLKIIPGLKTSPMFGHCGFDSVDKWREMAEDVRTACDATGQKQLAFENESALRKYYAGKCDVDLEQLRKGLELLPKDVEYFWYPSAAGSGERLQRFVQLDQAVDEVLNKVRFVDHVSLYAPREVKRPATLRAAAELEKVATHPTIPIVYCYGDSLWPYDQMRKALDLVKEKWGEDSWCILYPGNQRKWVTSAQAISKALREAPTAPKP